MRFEMMHPNNTGLTAVFGFDLFLSHFVEVTNGDRIVEEYDALHGDGRLEGVVRVLVAHGFLVEEDVALAHEALAHSYWPDIEDLGLRRAAEVLSNLRAAADEP